MITEKCTLPIGVVHNGKTHREVELRPSRVGDSVAALERERAQRNDSYLGLCVLAAQIIRLGDIPHTEITPELLMDMYDADMAEINVALRRLQARLASFRGATAAKQEAPAGADEDGLHAPGVAGAE